jgi:hypothetical protein
MPEEGRVYGRALPSLKNPPTTMTTYHHTTIAGHEHIWPVDAVAAARAAAWVTRAPAAFETDIAGMAEYFPHWLLAGSHAGRPSCCGQCDAPYVPTAGTLRCCVCGGAGPADGLIWLGHLPALVRPEPAFERGRAALRAAGFAEVTAGGAAYLLVPLAVAYPAEWPNVEPIVRYAGRWLDALGLPRYSAADHLVGNGQACLFAWGQWSAMPIHGVLQQRVVNHLASLLKIAAGQPPRQAFVGRIHDEQWRPET